MRVRVWVWVEVRMWVGVFLVRGPSGYVIYFRGTELKIELEV